MLDPGGGSKWYGILEAGESRTPVVFDPRLQPAPKGQVYLYNADRDAVVPYEWSIVSGLLREVDGSQAAAIKRDVGRKLKVAREQFFNSRPNRAAPGRSKVAVHAAPPSTPDSDPWEDVVLEDIDFE